MAAVSASRVAKFVQTRSLPATHLFQYIFGLIAKWCYTGYEMDPMQLFVNQHYQ